MWRINNIKNQLEKKKRSIEKLDKNNHQSWTCIIIKIVKAEEDDFLSVS